MDVVKRGVESLRGRIQIISTSGRGTSFSVLLPLTLAITDGMLVRVGEERYIIPTINIHISFRPKPDELAMIAGRGEMVMQRGELMPIFRLHRIYEVAGAIENATEGLLVVVSDKDKKCALLVDELLGQQQVVAKSLPHLGSIPGVSGGAILGDGCVGLIIDPTQLLAFARSAAGTTAA
jgi:two-component system chemotaxis sensor kinase CheA